MFLLIGSGPRLGSAGARNTDVETKEAILITEDKCVIGVVLLIASSWTPKDPW